MKWIIRLLIAACLPALPGALAQTTDTAPFGDVTVYKPQGAVSSVAIFLSGDGGWN